MTRGKNPEVEDGHAAVGDSLMDKTAVELASLVREGEASPSASVEACLARVEERDRSLNAFVHVCAEAARSRASVQEQRLAKGEEPGPLAGVPVAVKDLEDVAGLPTTFGSVPFRDRVAARDSVQVARLVSAGAIVVGKTNTPEFGYTCFTKNRVAGVTRNPWNNERTPGGSSGGSAAAVAARMVPLATGSDGGGSTRIPACYVGAFGIKPTFGRIPFGPGDHGSMQWSDTIHYGPITRTVADAALFLDVTCGYHPGDPNSLPRPPFSYRELLDDLPSRLRVGYSADLGYAVVQDDVGREVESAVQVFAAMGHDVDELDLVLPDLGRCWAFIAGAEIYGALAPEVEGREEELGRSFWKGVRAASSITARDIGEIQRARRALNETLAELFSDYDLLLTPQLPTEAFAAGGPLPHSASGRAFSSPLHAVAFTYPFNLSGHPAASIRAGFSDAGLPVGLQIVAERHRDELVLQASRAYEQQRPMNDWPL